MGLIVAETAYCRSPALITAYRNGHVQPWLYVILIFSACREHRLHRWRSSSPGFRHTAQAQQLANGRSQVDRSGPRSARSACRKRSLSTPPRRNAGLAEELMAGARIFPGAVAFYWKVPPRASMQTIRPLLFVLARGAFWRRGTSRETQKDAPTNCVSQIRIGNRAMRTCSTHAPLEGQGSRQGGTLRI